MKKFLLYALTAVFALGTVSCKDDEVIATMQPDKDFDRMPMTMFRLEENTNVSNDPYGTRVITEERNTVELAWYGVAGAAGYEIKFGLQPGLTSGLEEDWSNPQRLYQWEDGKYSKIVGPETLTLTIKNLEYSTAYRFAIRVLHPDGVEEHHSKWYGYGNGREWADQCGLTTEVRYDTPGLINVGNISENKDAFTVYINKKVADALDAFCSFPSGATDAEKDAVRQQKFEEFKQDFDIEPGEGSDDFHTAMFKVDYLSVLPSADTPDATVDDKFKKYYFAQNGVEFNDGKAEIRVTGLQENCVYLVDVFNEDIPVPVDARYNTIRKPVYGEPGEPILLKHIVYAQDPIPGAVENNASPLDTIIGNFVKDITLAEGQTFYLEGGKTYYFYAHPGLCKGFTLETDPADVAEGKRATVYMGGMGVSLDEYGNRTANLNTCNLMFGKEKAAGEADAPIEVGSVIFRNIDFDCPGALNYGHNQENLGSASGNYFANMYSGGMEVSFESFEVYNCTFQRMVRGFMRVQGTKKKTFKKIVIDGNLFYNCGYYDNNGRGYAWIAGDGNSDVSNIYTDFQWTNNTMYDSPRTAMISDNDKDRNYDPSVKWNIRIENNTFFNYSTRSTGRNIFQTRYVPSGSHYSFQRNLIVLAADKNDKRNLNQYGADVRSVKGDGIFTFTFKDNYSIGCRPEHLADDKIFNASQFSNKKNSFGTFETGWVDCSKDDLVVKVGATALTAEEAFNNPNPPYTQHDPSHPNHRDHEAPADIMNALKFKQSAAIQAHEIYQKNVGDPRWR